MGGTELMLMVFADPPTVRLLTAIVAPPFNAGIVSFASLMLKLPIGNDNVPAVLETTRVLLGVAEMRLMALTPPPETMVLARTVPPVTFSVPVTVADPPLVRARRSSVGT